MQIGKNVTGYELSYFLEKYAEIGFEYVIKVTNMIKNNKLNQFEYSKLENF